MVARLTGNADYLTHLDPRMKGLRPGVKPSALEAWIGLLETSVEDLAPQGDPEQPPQKFHLLREAMGAVAAENDSEPTAVLRRSPRSRSGLRGILL